jgi:hypothetical protein
MSFLTAFREELDFGILDATRNKSFFGLLALTDQISYLHGLARSLMIP